MEKFLIINPFGIGDVLFTTPVIKVLKEDKPDCFIGYWCNEKVAGILRDDKRIKKIFALSRGDIKRVKGQGSRVKKLWLLVNLIRNIRAEKFDATFDFSLDARYGLWSMLAGIKKRIGFDYKSRGRFLTDKIELEGYSGKHVAEYCFDLLEFAGIKPAAMKAPYNLDVSETNSAKAKNILSKFGIMPSTLIMGMAMGGGASWGPDAEYKQWPAKKFAQLADKLIKDTDAYMVLLGSYEEKSLANAITDEVKSKKIIDLTGKLSLEELAAIIKELRILICNDGGPLHMAVALGVKTVSMFGPVDDMVYGPYPPSDDHIVVKKDLPCRPCYKNFRFKGCFNNRQCLEDITVDEVYERIKRLA